VEVLVNFVAAAATAATAAATISSSTTASLTLTVHATTANDLSGWDT